MKSLDDVTEPQEGIRFFTWGPRQSCNFFFKSEFHEPQFSNVGLLEAEVIVEGVEYIFAPGSRRLLFALKPFTPLKGKTIQVTVSGEGMERNFIAQIPSKTKPTTLDDARPTDDQKLRQAERKLWTDQKTGHQNLPVVQKTVVPVKEIDELRAMAEELRRIREEESDTTSAPARKTGRAAARPATEKPHKGRKRA